MKNLTKRLCMLFFVVCMLLTYLPALSLGVDATCQDGSVVLEDASKSSVRTTTESSLIHPDNPCWITAKVNGEYCLLVAAEPKKLHIYNLDKESYVGHVPTPFDTCGGIVVDHDGVAWMVGDRPYIFRYDPVLDFGENAYIYKNITGAENSTSVLGVTGGLGITVGNMGTLYFGCYPGGELAKYTPNHGLFVNAGKVGTDDANCYANAPVCSSTGYVYVTTAGDTNNDGVRTFELAKFHAESCQLIKRVDITQYFSQDERMVRGMALYEDVLFIGGEPKEQGKALTVNTATLEYVDLGIETPIWFNPASDQYKHVIWFAAKDGVYKYYGNSVDKLQTYEENLQVNATSYIEDRGSLITYQRTTGQFVIVDISNGKSKRIDGFLITANGVSIDQSLYPMDSEMATVQKRINEIAALGKITLEHEAQIREIREAYNGLTRNQREGIDTTLLRNAENEIAKLNEEARDQDITRLKELIDTISQINDVTLEHEAIIDEAYEIYSNRRDYIVKNHREIDWATLLSASIALWNLQIKAADTVDTFIALIGEDIQYVSEARIREARSMYEALTPGSKERVTRLKELEKAEQELEKLLALKEKAEEVDALIAQLRDPVDIFSGSAIREAREAYDALPEDAQDYVIELGRLQEAEELYANALTWTVILTAAAVVVLAGGGVTVFLVLKKRKKAA